MKRSTLHNIMLLIVCMVFLGAVIIAFADPAAAETATGSGGIWASLLEKLLEFGGLPLLLLIVGYLAGQYLKPWVHKTDSRLEKAQEIALIADRITDEMLLMFPNARWDDWLDKAVDKLISACDLKDADAAKREILSNVWKKQPEIIAIKAKMATNPVG